MQITVSKTELYTMIKKAVKDVIHEERIDLILKDIPYISDEEQRDIEERYGKKPPKRRAVRREILDI